jgi:transcriptional regulator with XRE-family HTH domain
MKYIRDAKGLKQFGKRLRELREKYKISQDQLAFESGISANQIRRIEKGEINTGISTILAIAKALEIHPKELLDFPIS